MLYLTRVRVIIGNESGASSALCNKSKSHLVRQLITNTRRAQAHNLHGILVRRKNNDLTAAHFLRLSEPMGSPSPLHISTSLLAVYGGGTPVLKHVSKLRLFHQPRYFKTLTFRPTQNHRKKKSLGFLPSQTKRGLTFATAPLPDSLNPSDTSKGLCNIYEGLHNEIRKVDSFIGSNQ